MSLRYVTHELMETAKEELLKYNQERIYYDSQHVYKSQVINTR